MGAAKMKLTKQRLKKIIREELSGLGEGDSADRKWASNPSNPEFEGDESDQDAQIRLQRAAASLGAGEDFVAMVREAITNAVSSEGMGWDRALGTMVDALEMLSPMQEADFPDADARGRAWSRSLDPKIQFDGSEVSPDYTLKYRDGFMDEEEPLVLGKDGPPSPEKIAQQRRQLKRGFKKWRK